MRGGHTDNYYYQMIDGIRRFKGVRPDDVSTDSSTIKVDGNFADWDAVRAYRDYAGDAVRRNSRLWWPPERPSTTPAATTSSP
jgi:hypothetical protein